RVKATATPRLDRCGGAAALARDLLICSCHSVGPLDGAICNAVTFVFWVVGLGRDSVIAYLPERRWRMLRYSGGRLRKRGHARGTGGLTIMKQIASGQNIPAWSIGAAFVFFAVAMWGGYRFIGLPPVVIVGGSGAVALMLWLWTFRRGPIDTAVILPPFLLTV